MLLNVLRILLDVASIIIIVQIILSLLIAFNIISRYNSTIDGIWRGLTAVTEPVYRPIRRILPDTGAIDFAPMIVLIIIRIIEGPVMAWLYGLALSSGG